MIIRGLVELDATTHTDGLDSYDGIMHRSYIKHYRIHFGSVAGIIQRLEESLQRFTLGSDIE
jgi:hypothetical protein